MQVAAIYYDGQTATPIAVELAADSGGLLMRWADGELLSPWGEVRISERLGNTPRLISFARGGHCEVSDHARLDALLDNLGMRRNWLDTLQHSLGWALASLLLIVVVALGSYRYVLPWAAERLSTQVPAVALQKMSESTLQLLNRYTLQPSTLSDQRQQEVIASFARLTAGAAEVPRYQIHFYHSKGMGANAFALPDGTIVVLDELVALTQDDNEIGAVLAHELGHVQRRHGVRMLLQSSIVGLVLSWYIGDFSTLLAGAPTILLQAKYSRDMESEADAYAAQTLQRNGLSSCLLADILGKLEASHQKKETAHPVAANDAPASNASASNIPAENNQPKQAANIAADYLSSHPATRERIQALCPQR